MFTIIELKSFKKEIYLTMSQVNHITMVSFKGAGIDQASEVLILLQIRQNWLKLGLFRFGVLFNILNFSDAENNRHFVKMVAKNQFFANISVRGGFALKSVLTKSEGY